MPNIGATDDRHVKPLTMYSCTQTNRPQLHSLMQACVNVRRQGHSDCEIFKKKCRLFDDETDTIDTWFSIIVPILAFHRRAQQTFQRIIYTVFSAAGWVVADG